MNIKTPRIIKETPSHVTVLWSEWVDDAGKKVRQTSRLQKLLCVGGPFNMQLKASIQLDDAKLDEKYKQYNCGEFQPRSVRKHKAVYIHTDMLP